MGLLYEIRDWEEQGKVCRMLEANVMLKLMDDVDKRVLTQHFVCRWRSQVYFNCWLTIFFVSFVFVYGRKCSPVFDPSFVFGRKWKISFRSVSIWVTHVLFRWPTAYYIICGNCNNSCIACLEKLFATTFVDNCLNFLPVLLIPTLVCKFY